MVRPLFLAVPMTLALRLLGLVLALLLPLAAQAQAPLKIGAGPEETGPFAAFGRQMMNGMQLYMKQHGDTVAGRKIVLIVRDPGR